MLHNLRPKSRAVSLAPSAFVADLAREGLTGQRWHRAARRILTSCLYRRAAASEFAGEAIRGPNLLSPDRSQLSRGWRARVSLCPHILDEVAKTLERWRRVPASGGCSNTDIAHRPGLVVRLMIDKPANRISSDPSLRIVTSIFVQLSEAHWRLNTNATKIAFVAAPSDTLMTPVKANLAHILKDLARPSP